MNKKTIYAASIAHPHKRQSPAKEIVKPDTTAAPATPAVVPQSVGSPSLLGNEKQQAVPLVKPEASNSEVASKPKAQPAKPKLPNALGELPHEKK